MGELWLLAFPVLFVVGMTAFGIWLSNDGDVY